VKQGLPPTVPNNPLLPAEGWNALSLTYWRTARMGLFGQDADRAEKYLWPERYQPTEKIGKGIWLYYFPPNSITPPDFRLE
jgi:hypothetical protein